MLSEQFEALCRSRGAADACFLPDGTRASYLDLLLTVLGFAERLEDAGIGPGSTLVVDIDDPVARLALRLALLRLGAVSLPPLALRLAEPPAGMRHLAARDETGAIRFSQDWITPPKRLARRQGGGAAVFATSGSTGFPKLRARSDGSLLHRILRGLDQRGRPEGPMLLGYGAHSSGEFMGALQALFSGSALVFLDPAALERTGGALDRIEQTGAREAWLTALRFDQLVAQTGAAQSPLPRLETIRVGGSALSPALAARGEALFGARVISTYGSSETGSLAHIRSIEAEGEPGLLGQLYPDVELSLRRDDGSPAEAGAPGRAYFRLDPRSLPRDWPSGAALTDAEGWIDSGDILRRREDGALVLVGRVSELLNISGDKYAPRVFEAALEALEPAARALAFRLPGPDGSDAAGLAILGSQLSDAALREGLAQRLGPVARFCFWRVDALPYLPSGKPDRKQLSAIFSSPAAPQGIFSPNWERPE